LERLAAINDATAARVEAAADLVLGPAGPAKMDDTTECLAVPRAAVGRVIGKRGATIKGIERDSGCRVRVVDGDDDGDDAEVRVSHPDEARRAAALDAVLAIVERDQYRPPPSRGNTADRGRRDEF
jgi:predicted PilT family ATPase